MVLIITFATLMCVWILTPNCVKSNNLIRTIIVVSRAVLLCGYYPCAAAATAATVTVTTLPRPGM